MKIEIFAYSYSKLQSNTIQMLVLQIKAKQNIICSYNQLFTAFQQVFDLSYHLALSVSFIYMIVISKIQTNILSEHKLSLIIINYGTGL